MNLLNFGKFNETRDGHFSKLLPKFGFTGNGEGNYGRMGVTLRNFSILRENKCVHSFIIFIYDELKQ